MICVNRRFSGDEPSCAARGSFAIAEAIEQGVEERNIDIVAERVICFGHCHKGPTVKFPRSWMASGKCRIDDMGV